MIRSQTFRRAAVRCLLLLVVTAGFTRLTGCTHKTYIDEDRRGPDWHHDHY